MGGMEREEEGRNDGAPSRVMQRDKLSPNSPRYLYVHKLYIWSVKLWTSVSSTETAGGYRYCRRLQMDFVSSAYSYASSFPLFPVLFLS